MKRDEPVDEPDATVFLPKESVPRWAPWEWMVYEFEMGLSAPAKPGPKVYPSPLGQNGRLIVDDR